MTVDGNTIIVLSAAVAIVAAIVGSAWAVGRKIVRAEVSLEQHTAKLAGVDSNTARIIALEGRASLIEQGMKAHHDADDSAFARLEGEIKALRKEMSSLHDDVTEVLVAARLKSRADRGARET